jgi:protein-tyrosine phosphatase
LIDLHCHLLPGVDDGSRDSPESLTMARVAEADGTTIIACTPHVMAGVYENTGEAIAAAVSTLQTLLAAEGIKIRLVVGADVHVTPDLVARLRDGSIPTLAGSRYFLFEPPHHVIPPNLDRVVSEVLAAGYVPILTHPERLRWINTHYDQVLRLARSGVLMQVTAGSLTGHFGDGPQHWAEQLLEEGLVHLLASDAHDAVRRPPRMKDAFIRAAELIGEEETRHLAFTRPRGILANVDPSQLPVPQSIAALVPSGRLRRAVDRLMGRA